MTFKLSRGRYFDAMIPSPKQFLSNLQRVAKASTVNYPIGNESSIFVSEITKISTLPLVSSENLYLSRQ